MTMFGHGSSYDVGLLWSVKLNLFGFDQVLHFFFSGNNKRLYHDLDFQSDRRSGHSSYNGEKWYWGSSGLPSELPDWSSIIMVEFETRSY